MNNEMTEYSVLCPYCGNKAELADTAEVYRGRSYGMMYICRPCQAWVGCHKGTNKPLGRLANEQLRHFKQKAHAAFDPLWQRGSRRRFESRSAAYEWLAGKMRLSRDECHIGMFDVDDCKNVVQFCTLLLRNSNATR